MNDSSSKTDFSDIEIKSADDIRRLILNKVMNGSGLTMEDFVSEFSLFTYRKGFWDGHAKGFWMGTIATLLVLSLVLLLGVV